MMSVITEDGYLRTPRHVPNIRTPSLGAFTSLRKAVISFVMSSSLLALNKLASTGRIFMKLDI